ncbi:MAG: sigma-54-dependent Fis family transcriptional regulator [Planctomycetes bacterium]|nr:sigma-54-dependent Fis family transcriptional regulator [Planctomycetota bacterium]
MVSTVFTEDRRPHILIVDDELDTLRALVQGLHDEGFECSTARSAQEALERLGGGYDVQVVVTDLRLPSMDGLDFTRTLKMSWPEIHVIILTAFPTSDSALIGGRLGAARYLSKPVSSRELSAAIHEVLAAARSRAKSEQPAGAKGPGEPGESPPDHFHGLVGRHPLMRELQNNIEKLAKLPAPVLILGESGTGKELVARALHQSSPSRTEPFVAVNCGAIPRQLLESELFGHKKGAFTGADTSRVGLFVSAGRGVLFLDEIAELDLDLQVKLLRSLQEKEVTPLGSTQPVPWHARLICATNLDIDRAVAERRFRQDLYYRINVLRLPVPPLRARKSDILILIDWFLRRFCGDREKPKRISEEALQILMGYEWPGNVRQLENAIIQAVALGLSDEVQPEDLPAEILRVARHPSRAAFPTYDEVVRQHIIDALRLSKGVRTAAARRLGLDRNRLSRFIKRYRIDVERILEEEPTPSPPWGHPSSPTGRSGLR